MHAPSLALNLGCCLVLLHLSAMTFFSSCFQSPACPVMLLLVCCAARSTVLHPYQRVCHEVQLCPVHTYWLVCVMLVQSCKLGCCVMSLSGAGIIVSGTSAPGLRQQKQIASSELGQELQKARLDPKVKAVVLRVDSPGWHHSLKACW